MSITALNQATTNTTHFVCHQKVLTVLIDRCQVATLRLIGAYGASKIILVSFQSFFGGWAYSEALSLAEPSVVNIISATSGIFVCVLAALFPSNATDHFTFSKLAAAFLRYV